jgi:hypothetical protein
VDISIIDASKAATKRLTATRAENMTPGFSAYGGQTRSVYETGPPPDVVVPKPGLDAVGHNTPSTTSLIADCNQAMRWIIVRISSRSFSRLRPLFPWHRDGRLARLPREQGRSIRHETSSRICLCKRRFSNIPVLRCNRGNGQDTA